MKSDTPETDAAWEAYYSSATAGDPWELATKLERERNDARKAIRQWIEAWDKYGDGASMMHPRLTMAITAARKSLENVELICGEMEA